MNVKNYCIVGILLLEKIMKLNQGVTTTCSTGVEEILVKKNDTSNNFLETFIMLVLVIIFWTYTTTDS